MTMACIKCFYLLAGASSVTKGNTYLCPIRPYAALRNDTRHVKMICCLNTLIELFIESNYLVATQWNQRDNEKSIATETFPWEMSIWC